MCQFLETTGQAESEEGNARQPVTASQQTSILNPPSPCETAAGWIPRAMLMTRRGLANGGGRKRGRTRLFRLRLSCLGRPLHRSLDWVEPPTYISPGPPKTTLFRLTTMVVVMMQRSSRFYLSLFSTFDDFFSLLSLTVTLATLQRSVLVPLFVCPIPRFLPVLLFVCFFLFAKSV